MTVRIGSDTVGAEALGPTVVEIGAKSIPFDLRWTSYQGDTTASSAAFLV